MIDYDDWFEEVDNESWAILRSSITDFATDEELEGFYEAGYEPGAVVDAVWEAE